MQVTWGRLPRGPVSVRVADSWATLARDDGPGAVRVEGLPSDADLTVTVTVDGHTITRKTRTPASPPGSELSRFCTLSDMHLGETTFGLTNLMRERHDPAVAYPVRCTEAALDEARAWGAGHLIVKGDLTSRGRPEEYLQLAKLTEAAEIPYDAIPGNHEVKSYREIDPADGFASINQELADPVRPVDLPGVRLVLVDATVLGHHAGQLDRALEPVCDLVTAGPSIVVVHHHPQRFRLPYFWPPGIPPDEAERFLTALHAVNPDAMVITGHTHRHRRYVRHGVTVCETGSPKDFPGTWTGYVVHEGGLRQVVHRVARPDCIAWTSYTARAALGIWGEWSPGTLADRCFTHTWS